jgi:hypothetical protein
MVERIAKGGGNMFWFEILNWWLSSSISDMLGYSHLNFWDVLGFDNKHRAPPKHETLYMQHCLGE